MATLLLTAEAFTRAWALAKELDDAAAQARLHELWRQCLALPDDQRAHIFEEVAALAHELRRRQAADPRR